MNGFEFAETLRRDPRFAHHPIIALSALCTPAAIERGRQAGFDDYVAKFDRPGLIAALKELTGTASGSRHDHDRDTSPRRRQPARHRAVRHRRDRRPAVRPADRQGARRVRAGEHHAGPACRRRKSRASSTCAAASSRRSTCAGASACRRARASAAPWRSASSTGARSYGLIIDEVGEVLSLETAAREANPVNLDRAGRISPPASTACRDQLLVILDVERVLGGWRNTWQPDERGRGGPGARDETLSGRGRLAASSARSRGASSRTCRFTITEAEDGQQALDVCRQHMPDAILLDWNMPVMDGHRVPARKLRKLDGGERPEGRVLHHRERHRAISPGRCAPAPTNTS